MHELELQIQGRPSKLFVFLSDKEDIGEQKYKAIMTEFAG
jgi:hypothetical protein